MQLKTYKNQKISFSTQKNGITSVFLLIGMIFANHYIRNKKRNAFVLILQF
jgi:hypothetical protein